VALYQGDEEYLKRIDVKCVFLFFRKYVFQFFSCLQLGFFTETMGICGGMLEPENFTSPLM